ncbi:MAG: hypothetical protein U1E65_20615 [Myxococcota bacterium]
MMTHRFLSVLSLSLAASFYACGSDSTGADAGTGLDASSGSDSGTAALTCAEYCTKITANCTGANGQYSDNAACLTACAGFPVGAAADTSGNTLGCRTYHAGAAMTAPDVHCVHAGPSGGGACGSPCEGFCSVEAVACTGANAQTFYGTGAACVTACTTAFANKMTPAYASSVVSGDSLSCRLYHATVASKDSASAGVHCAHTSTKTGGGLPCN